LETRYDSYGLEFCAKKDVKEHNQKSYHVQQHFKLIFKLGFNEILTFIRIQTKTHPEIV